MVILGHDLSEFRTRYLVSYAGQRAQDLGFEVALYDRKGMATLDAERWASILAREPQAILWNPSPDSETWAWNATISTPLFFLDEGPLNSAHEPVSHIFQDEHQGGRELAEVVLDQLGGRTPYVFISDGSESRRVEQRIRGFRSVVDGVEDLEFFQHVRRGKPRRTGDQGFYIHLMESFPNGIVVCLDEASTIDVMRSPIRDPYRVYGVGGSEMIREAVRLGRLKAVLFPRCDLVAQTTVEWAYQYLLGERGMPTLQSVPPAIVTAQNIEEYRDYGHFP